jgi:hypothetical protein
MKKLTICPKCHESLLTSVPSFWDCTKYTNHKLITTTHFDSDDLLKLEIFFDMKSSKSIAVWFFNSKELFIYSNRVQLDGISIPFFDPEPFINNYDKLINKLKLYMIFI